MKHLLIILASLALLPGTLSASNPVYTNFIQAPAVNGALTVFDPDIAAVNPAVTFLTRNAMVRLVYDRSDRRDITGNNWTYTLNYTLVDGTDNYNGSLTIEHANAASVPLALRQIEGLATDEVTVTVTAVNVTGTPPTGGIRLELEMEVERYDALDGTMALTTTGHHYTVDVESWVDFNWNHITGMESAELEYVYWDDQATDRPTQAMGQYNATQIESYFRNATRLDLSGQSYKMDLTFPAGKLYARVRAVGRHIGVADGNYGPENRSYGDWSAPVEVTVNAFSPNISWQYTTAFAENGLHKKVVTYFDPSMRSRQVVTRLNDVDMTLVAETDYSVEGQQALQIMPALANPQGENNLFFKPSFNRNSTGDPYSFADFDKTSGADALSDASGAGRYFSAQNNYDVTYRDYIPDAGGYPLVQTRHTRDATGRVEAQGGAGGVFQLGGGHETRQFYGNPSETELLRLFGSNVGDACHYEKNLVLDPNGQVSVTYVDMAGKTIATALSGATPGNVVELPTGGGGQAIEANLMGANRIEGAVSRAENNILNGAVNTPYNFEYDLTGAYNVIAYEAQAYEPNTGDVWGHVAGTICESCNYELDIYITGPDGLVVTPSQANTQLVNGHVKNVYTGAQLQNCANQSYTKPTITFSATFVDIGNYTVTKELRRLDPDVSEYAGVFTGIGPSLPDFEEYYAGLVNVEDCNYTCYDHCRQLALEANLTENGAGWDEFIDGCIESDCMPLVEAALDDHVGDGECGELLYQIQRQLSPGGAFYADYTVGAGFVASQVAVVVSVMDANHDLYTVTYENNAITGNGFLPDGGQTYVPSILLADKDGNNATNVSASDFLFIYVIPQGPNNAYPDYFQPQWAEALAPFHREYCHYTSCMANRPSARFDLQLGLKSTWAEAFDDDLLTPPAFNVTDPEDFTWQQLALADPYFTFNFQQYQCRADKIDDLVDYGAIPNQNGPIDITQYAAYVAGLIIGDMPQDITTDELEWHIFRGAYLDLKNRAKYSCASCAFQNDANALVTVPDILALDPNDPAQIQAWILDHIADNCGSTCEANVDNWIIDINIALLSGACGPGNQQLSGADEATMRGYLSDYCLASCANGNPMGYMIHEDIATQPSLAAAASLLDGTYGCELAHFAVHYEAAYAPPLDANGDPLLGGPIIDGCAIQVIGAINQHVLPYIDANTASHVVNNIDAAYADCIPNLDYSDNGNCVSHPYSIDYGLSSNECGKIYLIFCLADGTEYNIGNLGSFDPNSVAADPNGPVVAADCIYTGIHVEATDVANNVLTLYPVFIYEPCTSYDFPSCHLTYAVSQTGLPIIEAPEFNTSTMYQDCVDLLVTEAHQLAQEAFNAYIGSLMTQYHESRNNCFASPFAEKFRVSYSSPEHHYTLYYYDQAGSLVQTVPPEGVHPVAPSHFTDGIWDETEPAHTLPTKYKYNTLGQVTWQESPDGGVTRFWYDRAGRLKLSQNAKQAADVPANNSGTPVYESIYSYTKYDAQGRISESGQVEGYYVDPDTEWDHFWADLNNQSFPMNNAALLLVQQVATAYDDPTGGQTFPQDNLRGRVAQTSNEHQTTRYSYDVFGNVKVLEHEIDGFGTKRLAYDYDLLSGKVNEVAYNEGESDEFRHRYRYDADNRLRFVETSRDGLIWDLDARYFYYAHGPLARVETGADKVQGQDYYYTFQGWIKGVNMVGDQNQATEPGRDGNAVIGNADRWFARDGFSYGLGYFDGDYDPIGTGLDLGGLPALQQNSDIKLASGFARGLFNGNITAMATQIVALANADMASGINGMTYQYDQLQRIKTANSHSLSGGSWSNTNYYTTAYSYDANGNLQTLSRNAYDATAGGHYRAMDILAYSYNFAGGNLSNNKLRRVTDAVSCPFPDDIETQTNADNYGYDEIGNLIKDESEYIQEVSWTVQGKVGKVQFYTGHNRCDTEYTYDPMGNRLSKKQHAAGGAWTRTWYVRDPQGNIMSTYNETNAAATVLTEQPIYGSARLGTANAVTGNGDNDVFKLFRGSKMYEFSNHLGNVLLTLTDKVLGTDQTGDGRAEFYQTNVSTATDYYPFGSTMPGRSLNPGDYRFGFNGKENDANGEWGARLVQDYGFRLYNLGIGKFLSVDPLSPKYPELTPYQFASNTPIQAIDLDGLEGYKVTTPTETTIYAEIHYVPLTVINRKKPNASSGFTQEEVDKIEINLNKEFTKGNWVDINGNPVKFDIRFIKHEKLEEIMPNLDNNDINNPSMLLKKANVTSKKNVYGGYSYRQAFSQWRRIFLTDDSGHSAAHELFHNLTHNHKNAPSDLQQQIDPSRVHESHYEAGGIFIYGDINKNRKIEDINQKNIDDVLRTLPEKKN